MTTLPSFVELVATLGLDPTKGTSQDASSSCSSASQSSPSSPRADKLAIPASSPTRSRSSPSLRDYAARSRTASCSHPGLHADLKFAYSTPRKRVVCVIYLFILVRKVLQVRLELTASISIPSNAKKGPEQQADH
ncbi:hypothetical protein PQX77_000025 [Marasmius sp. AFHP31]|nr:hypothetical protein PQX77_000025 [Marasmius sp. AFHP31]